MCVCVRASSRRWWKHGQWESVPSCLFPNSQTFLVLKCTPSNCVWAKLRNQKTLRKKRNHPIFNVGKSIPKSISMWWHWRNFWGIRFYLLPQFHLFILCLVFFFSFGWWGWFRHSSGCLFSERSLLRQKSIFRVCLSNLWPLHKHSWMARGLRERMQHTPRSSKTTRVSIAVAIFSFKL